MRELYNSLYAGPLTPEYDDLTRDGDDAVFDAMRTTLKAARMALHLYRRNKHEKNPDDNPRDPKGFPGTVRDVVRKDRCPASPSQSHSVHVEADSSQTSLFCGVTPCHCCCQHAQISKSMRGMRAFPSLNADESVIEKRTTAREISLSMFASLDAAAADFLSDSIADELSRVSSTGSSGTGHGGASESKSADRTQVEASSTTLHLQGPNVFKAARYLLRNDLILRKRNTNARRAMSTVSGDGGEFYSSAAANGVVQSVFV